MDSKGDVGVLTSLYHLLTDNKLRAPDELYSQIRFAQFRDRSQRLVWSQRLVCLTWEGEGTNVQGLGYNVQGSPAGIWNSPYNQTQGHWISVFEIIPWSHPTRTKICLVPWKVGVLIGPESSCFSLCQCSWCNVVRRRTGETRVQLLCGLGHEFPHLIDHFNQV